ncbi:uncharacterized protein LOC106176334 [Lingula anatina]|uniref:Uncharacterized protein LOC106176334 n=1 Tax=Lingula anatina TaxID=7574 RepID=A0A1S3JUS5_LINAN|nr:uncharacterized protein LOC106176334 [Lingula anatina]XP_013414126.1 uncharacterized protein LOC106176334 [Lingula anatina]|eukprot:XP_013414125.1 uncharacterized protein LOC106176334 [Lingula anatina]
MHDEIVEHSLLNVENMSGKLPELSMQSSRGTKRLRSNDDYCEDCLPISKRINRLHIKQGDVSSDEEVKESSNSTKPKMCYCGNRGHFIREEVSHLCKTHAATSRIPHKQGLECPSTASVAFYNGERSEVIGDLGDLHLNILSDNNNTQHVNCAGRNRVENGFEAIHGAGSGHSSQHNSIVSQSQSLKMPNYGVPENIDEVMMDLESYEPELSEAENPYYFQSNHRLFEVHKERMERLLRNGTFYTYQT